MKSQVDGARDASTAATEHWDPEIVGTMLPASIIQSEGYAHFAEDYEPLLLSLINLYLSYGSGWVMEESHTAEIEAEYDRAEKLQKRAGLMYARALMYARRMLRQRDEGFDEAMSQGVPALKEWIDYHFTDADRDAEVMLATGSAWMAFISASPDGMNNTIDLPYARAFVEKAAELDPELNGARALWIMGNVECTVPELVGGRPREGMRLLKRAAKLTDRGNHMILVTMAEKCAVALQDRELFHSLLMEVIESGDVEEYRLSNKISRHRAERLISNIDEYFF